MIFFVHLHNIYSRRRMRNKYHDMKRCVNIVIDLKDTRKMCSDKKKLSDECNTCLSEIQDSVSNFLRGIEEKDNKQRARMSDEWAMFLTTADEKLDSNILRSKDETDRLNSNSKWILGVVLSITFALGTAFGILWGKVEAKSDRSEVMTKQEIKMLHDLTRAYNADQFVQNPQAKTDTTNYNWLVKTIFSGTMRGGN